VFNYDNLEIAYQRSVTCSASDTVFNPGNIVIIAASRREGKKSVLYGFLAEAKYVYPDRTAKEFWPDFHRPNVRVTSLKPLSKITKLDESLTGPITRSGIQVVHRQGVVDALRGSIKPSATKKQSKPITKQSVKETPKFGFVYLLKTNKHGYKIGKTINIHRRFNELGVGTRCELVGYWSTSDYHQVEKHLHIIFAKERCPQSEWFDIDESQATFVIDWLNKNADCIKLTPITKAILQPKFTSFELEAKPIPVSVRKPIPVSVPKPSSDIAPLKDKKAVLLGLLLFILGAGAMTIANESGMNPNSPQIERTQY
jgi:hypothetical protein